jgi:hypothetical protein
MGTTETDEGTSSRDDRVNAWDVLTLCIVGVLVVIGLWDTLRGR